MPTCNTCGAEMIANKRGVLYCAACASKRGKSSRAKGNTYQREAAAFLTEHGLHTLNTGIGQRRRSDKDVPDLSSFPLWPDRSILIRGEEKTLASLPKWLWACPDCGGSGKYADKYTYGRCGGDYEPCPFCAGSGHRGPMRPPAAWWWDVLEGVRCPSVVDGKHLTAADKVKAGLSTEDCGCHGTGWLSHPHDFLMLKRIAKPGEAAYEWLVLVLNPLAHVDGFGSHDDLRLWTIAATKDSRELYVYPADKWARAVVTKE